MAGRRAQGLSQILLPWVVAASEPAAGAIVCNGGGVRRLGSGLLVPGESCFCVAKEQAAHSHCSSSLNSWEMLSSSSFSSFLGLPLGFLPEVGVAWWLP